MSHSCKRWSRHCPHATSLIPGGKPTACGSSWSHAVRPAGSLDEVRAPLFYTPILTASMPIVLSTSVNRRSKWHSTSRPVYPGRDQKTGAVLWGVDRGVRGLYGAANRAVRGISVKVAFSCAMGQSGTETDQKGGGNQNQQREA